MSFRTGQRVKVVNSDKYTGFGTVEKVLTKNVDVMLDAGIRVRFNPYFLSADLDAPAPNPSRFVPVPAIGTVVMVNDGDARTAGPHVVIGDGISRGTVVAKVVKLGGDAGRYWRVPTHRLTVVKFHGLVTPEPAQPGATLAAHNDILSGLPL